MAKLILYIITMIFFIGCVPVRKLEQEQAKADRLTAEKKTCEEALKSFQDKQTTLATDLEYSRKQINNLIEDTTTYGQRYRKIYSLNEDLNRLYEKVSQQNKDLLTASSNENQRLNIEIEKRERELNKKEQQLIEKDQLLTVKEKNIEGLTTDLKTREARVKELEAILSRKDSAVNALKTKISQALLGFKENELTVNLKNGKVYVSLSEQLLFKSGSTVVDPKGKEALAKLAEVLKKQPDINILIEGHTDNVPLKGTGIPKDNWDLSVLRATSIVRILAEENKLDPTRIVASGRSEFIPVGANTTPEGKSKNRRTEIILSPKLDELLKLLE